MVKFFIILKDFRTFPYIDLCSSNNLQVSWITMEEPEGLQEGQNEKG
jgi:hypothetical protein